jgi:hypothetical protein
MIAADVTIVSIEKRIQKSRGLSDQHVRTQNFNMLVVELRTLQSCIPLFEGVAQL